VATAKHVPHSVSTKGNEAIGPIASVPQYENKNPATLFPGAGESGRQASARVRVRHQYIRGQANPLVVNIGINAEFRGRADISSGHDLEIVG
jgi:hypothetical protein